MRILILAGFTIAALGAVGHGAEYVTTPSGVRVKLETVIFAGLPSGGIQKEYRQ